MEYINIVDTLDDRFMEKFNDALDIIIKQRDAIFVNADGIQEALKQFLLGRKLVDYNKRMVGNYIKREDMIKNMLKFYESIDKELYQKTIKVVLGQNDRIKAHIYNKRKVKDFRKMDENGLPKYTIDGSTDSLYGNSVVNIPLESDEYCSLDEVYMIVHEIAHLFDLNPESTSARFRKTPDSVEVYFKRNFTRDILAETTAVAFEEIFTDYLRENTSYSRSEIDNNEINRIRHSFFSAQFVFLRLAFAKEKEKHEKVTKEDIKRVLKENGMDSQNTINRLKAIINHPYELPIEIRYALAGLIAPTMVEEYRKNKKHGIKLIKQYIQCVWSNNIKDALGVYKIYWDKRSIKRMIANVKKQEDRVRQDDKGEK